MPVDTAQGSDTSFGINLYFRNNYHASTSTWFQGSPTWLDQFFIWVAWLAWLRWSSWKKFLKIWKNKKINFLQPYKVDMNKL